MTPEAVTPDVSAEFALEDLRGGSSLVVYGSTAYPKLTQRASPRHGAVIDTEVSNSVRLEVSLEGGRLVLLLEYEAPDTESPHFRVDVRAFVPPRQLRLLRDFLNFALVAESLLPEETQ